MFADLHTCRCSHDPEKLLVLFLVLSEAFVQHGGLMHNPKLLEHSQRDRSRDIGHDPIGSYMLDAPLRRSVLVALFTFDELIHQFRVISIGVQRASFEEGGGHFDLFTISPKFLVIVMTMT